jgi:hypothetical protein
MPNEQGSQTSVFFQSNSDKLEKFQKRSEDRRDGK